MKKKLLNSMRMLLVAAGLCVGANAWADTKTLYPTGSTDPTSASLWTKHAHITATQNVENDYISFYHSQNGTRCFYLKFYETGSDIYSTYDTYTVSFDVWNTNAWSNSNSSDAELIMFGEGAAFPNPLYSLFTGANTSKKNYLMYLHGSGSWINNFYINGATESPVTFTKQNWYTVSITVTKSTGNVSYAITPKGSSTPLANGSASYTASSDQTSFNCQGLFFTLGKGGYETRIANVKVTTEVTGDNADAPTFALTGFTGSSRIFQINCNDSETIHYQVKDGESVMQSGDGASAGASVNVTVPAGQKLTAYTTKGTATSENTEITVTGGVPTLTAPVVTLTNLEEGFSKTYKVSGLTQTITEGAYSYNFEPTGIFYATSSTATSGTNISENTFTLSESGTYYVIITKEDATSSNTTVDNTTPYMISRTYDFGSSEILTSSWTGSGTEKWVNTGEAEAYKNSTISAKSTTELFEGFTVTVGAEDRIAAIHWHDGKGIQYTKSSGNFTIGLTTVPTGAIIKNEYVQNGSDKSELGNTVTIGRYNVTSEKQGLKQIKVYTPSTVSATLPSSGFGSLASAYGLDFSAVEGLTAYAVTAANSGTMTLTAVDELPANSGVILKGTAGATYSIPVKATAAYDGTNLLRAAVSAYNCAANEVYILQGGKFHLVTAASTVPAGKAYLPATAVSSDAHALSFVFSDDETTGINNVNVNHNDKWYDLQGRRVAAPQKGLYIMNGKKVIIK